MSTSCRQRQPTVLLDRDGTLSVEDGFVENVAQLRVLPFAADSCQRLADAGLRLIVYTNQSGIARGLYGQRDLARIHEEMHRQLRGLPRAYLHSPHHAEQPQSPYGYDSPYRKPGSGMVLQADRLFPIAWERSFVVGDTARDILPGRDLPLRRVLLKSGKPWQPELAKLHSAGIEPDCIAQDLAEATEWILNAEPW